jgi:hypothetical protein
MDHTDVWFQSADWNHLAEDSVQRENLVETEMNFRVKWAGGEIILVHLNAYWLLKKGTAPCSDLLRS